MKHKLKEIILNLVNAIFLAAVLILFLPNNTEKDSGFPLYTLIVIAASEVIYLEVADQFLEKVGLSDFKDKYPSQLSGGMQQRVAIARALAMDTEILLMDEPFGAIDARNRAVLQELLLELWEGDGSNRKTVLFVTHDIDEAILLSDRIIMMRSHPGSILREIEVPFERPRKRTEFMQHPEYNHFRNTLTGLFYSDIGDRIGGEELMIDSLSLMYLSDKGRYGRRSSSKEAARGVTLPYRFRNITRCVR